MAGIRRAREHTRDDQAGRRQDCERALDALGPLLRCLDSGHLEPSSIEAGPRGGRTSAEAAAGEGVAESEAWRCPVDEVTYARLQAGQDRVRLSLRQPAGGNGCVELLLGVADDRLDQAVDRLALRLGDIGERLAVLELGAELVFGQT